MAALLVKEPARTTRTGSMSSSTNSPSSIGVPPAATGSKAPSRRWSGIRTRPSACCWPGGSASPRFDEDALARGQGAGVRRSPARAERSRPPLGRGVEPQGASPATPTRTRCAARFPRSTRSSAARRPISPRRLLVRGGLKVSIVGAIGRTRRRRWSIRSSAVCPRARCRLRRRRRGWPGSARWR